MNDESGVMKALLVRFSPIVKKNWLPLSLGFLGMMFFVYGLIWFFSGSGSGSNDMVYESASTATQSSELSGVSIAIDVEGAVVKPGVFKLTLDSRIQDALIAAGGLSGTADRTWVEKNINLAAKLTDGAKIYVPRTAETSMGITGSMNMMGSLGEQININSASESELDSLSGIGPVTTKKIISGRPYSSIDDLLSKKIISSKVFSQIKEKITVY